MNIAIAMCKLFFAMLTGYYLNKKEILTGEINQKLSAMILDMTMPLLVLCSVASLGGDDKDKILLLLVVGIIIYAVVPGLSYILVKLLKCPKDCEGVYRCMFMFSNTAFMGYPVVEALYGSEAILYSTVLHFGFNIVFFSYGRYLIAKDAGDVVKFEGKQFLNAGVISGVIALIMCFAGVQLPNVAFEAFEFVGNVTMPLSMIVIGANMGQYSLKMVFGDVKMYQVAFVRLIIIPLITACLIRLVTTDFTVIGVTVVSMGMPVGASVAMAAGIYEKQGKTGAVGVALTTICSMITLPILALIIEFMFG